MHGSDMDMDNMVTESLGTLLKQTRRSQQKSIDDAAAATCIHIRTLRALEADDYSGMRAEIFVRGFIKIYAGYLGIDPDEAMEIYEKSGLRPPGHEPHHPNEDNDDLEEDEKRPSFPNSLLLGAVLVIIAVIFLAGRNIFFDKDSDTGTNLPPPIPLTTTKQTKIRGPVTETVETLPAIKKERPADKKTPREATTSEVNAANTNAPEPVAVEPLSPPEPPRKKLPPPIRYTVVAKFVESTWMKILIDNGPARQYTYHPGETRTWKAREKMRLFIGNAGGIRISVNGEDMPPLGPSGEVAKLSIPRGLARLREKKTSLAVQPEPETGKISATAPPSPSVAEAEPPPETAPSIPPAEVSENEPGAAVTAPMTEPESKANPSPAVKETVQPEDDGQ